MRRLPVFVLGVIFATAMLASKVQAHEGKKGDWKECKKEFDTLCPGPKGKEKHECLEKNESKLSEKCKHVMEHHKGKKGHHEEAEHHEHEEHHDEDGDKK